MRTNRQRKALVGLFLSLSVVTGWDALSANQTIVKADEIVIAEDKEIASQETYQEIRHLMDETIFADCEWVEAVVEKNSVAIGSPLWFSCAAEEWNVPTTGFENGTYVVKLYRVAADQVSHEADQVALTSVDFVINVPDVILDPSLEAKSTVGAESGKPTVTVKLAGVETISNIVSVTFEFADSKGDVVYSREVEADDEGNYCAEIAASKLNKKAGKYTVSAILKDVNGEETVLEQTAIAELKLANASVKAASADKKAGTFVFKTSEIKAINTVKSVKMKVWCKDSDLKTYSNLKKKSDGSYQVKVDVSKHDYHFGTYNVEVVVTLKDGSKAVVASKSYDFAPKNFMRYGKTSTKNKKTIWMYNPTVSSDIYADVWSKAGNGEDKITYEVEDKGTALKFTINMKKISNTGKVYVLFKQKTGQKYVDVKKVSFTATANDISKHGWFTEKASNGKTYRFYYSKGKKVTDLTKVLNIKKKKMYIEVNRKCNTVTVYEDSSKKTPVIAFACSVGNSWTPTPTGTYKTDRNHRWKELMGPSYGQYCTHIVGGIYFHSVAGRNTTPYNISAYSYNKLGSAASHGCIRLCVRDAKWIYDHCAIGTTVHIFDSDFNGPLGKPKTIKIPSGQNWDPTDPAVKK